MHTLMNDDPAAPRKRLPVPAPEALKAAPVSVLSPFDTLDHLDMLHGYVMLRATRGFRGVSEPFANALQWKLQHAGIKTNELNQSALANYGDEWVPDLWSAELWRRARLENAVLPLFRAIEMPSNPFEIPTEGLDPSVYYVAESAHESQMTLAAADNPIPDSKIGSGKAQLVAKKLALRVGFSAELVEDSVVPVLALYRQQAQAAISASIDYVLLNGDTAQDNTNVNKATGSPTFAGTERYLAFNGLRKLALGSAANKHDAAGAADFAKLRTARFKLPRDYAARPSDLAWIVDASTYAKLLGLGEFLTMDKAGPHATAINGQLGYMDGAPVVVSPEMPLTASDGKVDGVTPGNNVKGTALCVYRPGWFVGYRRRIAVSVDYLPYYDSYQMTATVRLAFINFDASVASALYNVTV